MNSMSTTSQLPLLYILSNQASVYQELLKHSSLQTIKLTPYKADATIVLADPPLLASQLDDFTALQWVQSTFAGIDKLIAPSLRQDYLLTNVKGIFGQLISEYVLGYSLSYFRHFTSYQQLQHHREWQPHPYQSVSGKKMLILGTGSIGCKLAETASALGFIPLGVNRSGQVPSPFKQGYPIEQLNAALAQADIVVNALPSTQQTRHLLNAEHLAHCQNTLLFNIGRGDAVNDEGLLTALEKGWIAHAYLDVFPIEPLSQHSPYWRHPNVTITPHIAATSFPEQVFEIFEQNCQRWLNHQPLLNQVDFLRGY